MPQYISTFVNIFIIQQNKMPFSFKDVVLISKYFVEGDNNQYSVVLVLVFGFNKDSLSTDGDYSNCWLKNWDPQLLFRNHSFWSSSCIFLHHNTRLKGILTFRDLRWADSLCKKFILSMGLWYTVVRCLFFHWFCKDWYLEKTLHCASYLAAPTSAFDTLLLNFNLKITKKCVTRLHP